MRIQEAQSLIIQTYGILGFETAKNMEKALEPYSMIVSFNDKTRKFTVYNSSHLNRTKMQLLFSRQSFTGLKPIVLEEVDIYKNRQIELKPINYMQTNL